MTDDLDGELRLCERVFPTAGGGESVRQDAQCNGQVFEEVGGEVLRIIAEKLAVESDGLLAAAQRLPWASKVVEQGRLVGKRHSKSGSEGGSAGGKGSIGANGLLYRSQGLIPPPKCSQPTG